MALELKWTKRADKKFDRILEYLSTEWGDKVTKSFVRKVYDFFDLLQIIPRLDQLKTAKKRSGDLQSLSRSIFFTA